MPTVTRRACLGCGSDITGRRPDALYCSTNCAKRTWREHQHAVLERTATALQAARQAVDALSMRVLDLEARLAELEKSRQLFDAFLPAAVSADSLPAASEEGARAYS